MEVSQAERYRPKGFAAQNRNIRNLHPQPFLRQRLRRRKRKGVPGESEPDDIMQPRVRL